MVFIYFISFDPSGLHVSKTKIYQIYHPQWIRILLPLYFKIIVLFDFSILLPLITFQAVVGQLSEIAICLLTSYAHIT